MYRKIIGRRKYEEQNLSRPETCCGHIFNLHVICPIIALAAHISIGDISEVISSAQFGPMLWNSFISSLVTTIVSVSLALLLAWCVNRTRIRHKGVWSVIFTLPMLIPSISHGMGLTIIVWR